MYVDTKPGLEQLMEHMRPVQTIGFDTEFTGMVPSNCHIMLPPPKKKQKKKNRARVALCCAMYCHISHALFLTVCNLAHTIPSSLCLFQGSHSTSQTLSSCSSRRRVFLRYSYCSARRTCTHSAPMLRVLASSCHRTSCPTYGNKHSRAHIPASSLPMLLYSVGVLLLLLLLLLLPPPLLLLLPRP